MVGHVLAGWRTWAWVLWLLAAMLLLAFLDLAVHGLVVSTSVLVRAMVSGPGLWRRQHFDKLDLAVAAGLYVEVVALFRVAFRVFKATNVVGLFLCFGAGLTWGVAGPVFYTVRHGWPLSDLGMWFGNWKSAAALGLVLASIHFAITFLVSRCLPRLAGCLKPVE